MKKLMMAVAIVCAAVAAKAATVNWQSGTIYTAIDAAGAVGTTKANTSGRLVTMYIYEFATEDAYTAAQSLNVESLYDTYLDSAIGSGKSSGTGVAKYGQTVGDASGAHYALALFVDTVNANLPDGKTAFVNAAFATATVDGSGTYAAGDIFNSKVSPTWVAYPTSSEPEPIPEPTSGLLMLLGLAGLALKRKRA